MRLLQAGEDDSTSGLDDERGGVATG